MATQDESNSLRPDAAPSKDSTDAPLRIAVAGAGKMARHHAYAIRRLQGVAEVVGVCDPSSNAVDGLRKIWPTAAGASTLGDLFQKGSVDVVHVCTPPTTHDEVAAAALEAGCHIYVEKPFAPSSDIAERLIGMAEDRQVRVCAGHQLLFEAPARRLLELLPAVGSLSHVESFFSFRTVRRSPDGRAPLPSDLQLLDILPHPVYLLLHLLEAVVPGGTTELRGIEIGPAGTVHALVGRGELTGTLVVTLDGRPIESYVRAVGSNGSVYADFVRGTVQRLIGPGSSGIDKVLGPYRLSRQLAVGTTAAIGRRVLKRQRSYPGLAELLGAFYAAIRSGEPSPISPETILETVRVCEGVEQALRRPRVKPRTSPAKESTTNVAVTGGTGFLGAELVRVLVKADARVRVIARRQPPDWERVSGAEYVVADLTETVDQRLLSGVDTVIHCAAATSGGWEEHRLHSLSATENVLRAAAEAGVGRFVHVSSLAVLQTPDDGTSVTEESPLRQESRRYGPYVWGKLESEKLAARMGPQLGVTVKIVRPGAIVDARRFDPPGRLGKRFGNIFIAVGSPRDTLGIVELSFAARTLAWIARHFDQAPPALNLLAPKLPTKRMMLAQLRQSNPDLRVVWLPHLLLSPLSLFAIGVQKMLRPKQQAINVSSVFARQDFGTDLVSQLAARLDTTESQPAEASHAARSTIQEPAATS